MMEKIKIEQDKGRSGKEKKKSIGKNKGSRKTNNRN